MRVPFKNHLAAVFCFVVLAIHSQTKQNYSITKIFTNQKANTLVKDKAIAKMKNKHTFVFETDCGKIFVRFKKVFTLKLRELTATSEPCSDILMGIYEDIRTSLRKVTNVKSNKQQLVFFHKKDTLMLFDQLNN